MNHGSAEEESPVGPVLDFTPLLPSLQAPTLQALPDLRGRRTVVAMGSRAMLAFFCQAQADQLRLVGAATTAAETQGLVERQRPELLIATDHQEQGCGIDLVVQAKTALPRLQCLLIATQPHRHRRLQAALQAGCNGLCLESRVGMGTLRAAIAAVSGGGVYIDAELAELLRGLHAQHLPVTSPSRRELAVLELVMRGCSNTEIGERLYLSVDTVKTHLRNLRRKLQARDRTHAVVIGLCRGLLPWPEL